MRRVEVERLDNGWLVTTYNVVTRREVLFSKEAMLAAVYRAVCDWSVGDRVQVIQ